MPVDISEAIQDGIDRTIARNGLYLVAITFVIGVVNGLAATSVTRGFMENVPGQPPFGPTAPATAGPSLGLSPAVAGLLSLLLGLVSLVVSVGAIRTFVTDETEALPTENFSRNVVLAAINLIVGGIVFGIVVGIGFVLLVVPGIFLLVSLYFWSAYVIVEDENFVEAFRSAWDLASGNRVSLFLLGVIVWVVVIVVGIVFGIPAAILPGILGVLVNQVGSAFVGVFVLATTARAWVQLTGGAAAPAAAGGGAMGDDPAGAGEGMEE